MIKMERTCGCMRCDVILEGEKIGTMEGVYLTQWFVKNRYRYTGTFSRYLTENPNCLEPGITVDIIFPNKIVIKDAFIEWIRQPNGGGTFNARGIESCI
jgi:hypothetical protein